jgi:hypothetical protein
MLYAHMLLELVNTQVTRENSSALVAIRLAAVVAPRVSIVCSVIAVLVCGTTEGAVTACLATEIASFSKKQL